MVSREQINAALTNAKQLARAIVPDLGGVPLYIIEPKPDSIVTRADLRGHPGMFYHKLCAAIQPELEREGRWEGHGVAIIVDAVRVFALSRTNDDAERKLTGILLHELTHRLDQPEPTEDVSQQVAYEAWRSVNDKRAEWERRHPELSTAFVFHDETFIRLCCHLWYRANHCRTAGMALAPHCLGFGNAYRGLEYLESPIRYINALGDELERYSTWPLREVLQQPQPEPFDKLWRLAIAAMLCERRADPAA